MKDNSKSILATLSAALLAGSLFAQEPAAPADPVKPGSGGPLKPAPEKTRQADASSAARTTETALISARIFSGTDTGRLSRHPSTYARVGPFVLPTADRHNLQEKSANFEKGTPVSVFAKMVSASADEMLSR